MFYKLLFQLSDHIQILNVFKYITFRTFISFITAFVVCALFGKKYISKMQKKQFGQIIREDGPQSHLKKKGTPTMGGGLMLIGLVATSVLWIDLANPMVLTLLFITFSFGMIGYIDDYLKVSKKNAKGVKGRTRLIMEFFFSAIAISYLVTAGLMSTELTVPFFKNFIIDIGWLYVPFASFVIVGCANAVNLTDGLDGLAIVPVIISVGTFVLLAYITGHANISGYLQIPHVPGAGELAPVGAALVGCGLGFLWYNTYPAQVFMGDIGSLSIGGFLGAIAVLTKNELLLAIVGGVFVASAFSVIAQVISFKLTGKRIFKMAPLHHHFELKGIDEPKVIVRFWIVAILLAIISLTTLKLR